jgi:hypothetical protein
MTGVGGLANKKTATLKAVTAAGDKGPLLRKRSATSRPALIAPLNAT